MTKNKLHIRWSKAVRERDGCCQVCGKKDGILHAAHIIPDQFKRYQYEVDNGVTLCFQHHIRTKWAFHQNPLFFANWLKEHKPDIYAIAAVRLAKENEA